MNSQQGATFYYLQFHNFVQGKCLVLLNCHLFLIELVILNPKSLGKMLMLLRSLDFQWPLTEAFLIQKQHLF